VLLESSEYPAAHKSAVNSNVYVIYKRRRKASLFVSLPPPKKEYQRCIVHQVRNTLKYVPDKDRKAFATDRKTIYHASDESKAREALEKVLFVRSIYYVISNVFR
jgi:hypothetical protein